MFQTKYLSWCIENNIQAVTEDKYRRIFCSSYNIGFKLPKTDTCEKCDRFKIQIESSMDEKQKRSLEIERDLHQKRAEGMQK